MVGIPTALLLLASNRRNDAARVNYDAPPPRYQHQPPVVILAPHQTQPEYEPYGGRQGYALPDAGYQPQITARSSSVIHGDWAEVDDW